MENISNRIKINKSLEEMDATHLQSAHIILKELVNQQKYATTMVDKNIVDTKIANAIQQLDKGEGTDFGMFLNEIVIPISSKLLSP